MTFTAPTGAETAVDDGSSTVQRPTGPASTSGTCGCSPPVAHSLSPTVHRFSTLPQPRAAHCGLGARIPLAIHSLVPLPFHSDAFVG